MHFVHLALLLLQLQTPALRGVQLQVQRRPDTVTVGQYFTVVVRVIAPLHSTVQFPAFEGAGAMIDTAAPTVRHDTIVADHMEWSVTYTMAAWDIGARRFVLGDVGVQTPEGEQVLTLDSVSVFVRSVLPQDSSKYIPKDAQPLFPDPMRAIARRRLLMRIAMFVAVLLLVGVLAWLLRRYLARRVPPEPDLSWAEREFRKVEALRLLEQGEPERHAILMREILRGYVIRQFPRILSSATTREMAVVLRTISAIPAERMLSLFESNDLLKYAAAPLSGAAARASGIESRALVRYIEEQVATASRVRETLRAERGV